MSDLWGELGKIIGSAQTTLDAAYKEVERAANDAGRGIADTVDQVQYAFSGQAKEEPVNIAALPEHQRVAFVGALYALAVADGSLDKEELQLIVDLSDLEGLSAQGRQMVLRSIIVPPAFNDTIAPFSSAPEAVRYALLLNLLEVAWANDLLSPKQDILLSRAQSVMGIGDEQYRAIWRFVREMRAVRLRGQNDRIAAQATKVATAGLAAVGVPIAIVYVSGSVIGLSAAGITSGLAALGLGLGMVPGIGIAVLLGTGVFLGVRALLDAATQDSGERLEKAISQRAQAVIVTLEEMIALLDQEIAAAAAQAETRSSGIWHTVLSTRQRVLSQILARRRAIAEGLG